jgi:hypothetical protein
MGSHQSHDANTVVWLTPPWILERLGEFDLDPCAAPEPRPWPTAYKHIGLPNDGLAAEWKGRVWLNPPYGRYVGNWLRKMGQHGNGTALIFARTETDAFQHVWDSATAILFVKGRVTFCKPDGTSADANGGAPSALIAYGDEDAYMLLNSGIEGQFFYVGGSPHAVRIRADNDNSDLFPEAA